MFNSIYKKLMILIICVVVSLPTNAAVSVSDGSAFVTKSEFNSDINNLQNRMAFLENSLDSKIDNLVSSYLTRNGIWNGESQEVLNNLGHTSSTSAGQYIFEDISKSGLMLLPYYIQIDYEVGICIDYNPYSGNPDDLSYNRGLGSPIFYGFSVNVSVYNDTTSELLQQDELFYTLCGEFDTANHMDYALKLNKSPGNVFTFFVEKGCKLRYTLSTSLDARMDWWGMVSNTVTGNEKTLSGRCMGGSGNVRSGKWIDGSKYKVSFGISGDEISVY